MPRGQSNGPGLRSSSAILSGTEKESVGVLLGDAMGSKGNVEESSHRGREG